MINTIGSTAARNTAFATAAKPYRAKAADFTATQGQAGLTDTQFDEKIMDIARRDTMAGTRRRG